MWKLIERNNNNQQERPCGYNHPLTPQEFSTCPYLDQIITDHNVYCILLVGSSITGLTDSHSDYDLAVIVDKQDTKQPPCYMEYNNTHLHGYYCTIDELLNPIMFLQGVGRFQYRFISQEQVLYLNPQHQDKGEEIFNLRYQISLAGARKIQDYALNLIPAFIQNPSNEALPLKGLSTMLHVYYVHSKQPVNKDLIMKAKRMRYNPLSTDDLSLLIQELSKVYEFYQQGPVQEV